MSGTYSVTVTDNKGCSAVATTSVTVNPNPTVTASSNSPVCLGSGIYLSSNPLSGTPPYNFNWAGPGGFTSTSQNPTRMNATLGMTGTYYLTITDAYGCSASSSTSLNVSLKPNLTCNVIEQPGCSINSGIANAIATGGTAPYNYQWSNGATTQTVTGLGAGTYSVTATDANGCEATSAVILTSTESPTIDIESNSPVCVGSDIYITSSVNGGTPPYNYIWVGPGGYSSSSQNISRTSATLAMGGIYGVTVTDSKGCTAVAFTSVAVNPNPTVSASSSSPVCGGSSINLISIANGGTSPYTYSWSGPAGFTSTMQNPIRVNANPGMNGTYTVTITDIKGCSAIDYTVVTVNQNPTISLNANPVCVGSTIQLTSTPSGGTAPYNYSWSGPAGYTSSVQNPTRLNAGISMGGWYTLTVTDVNGCTATASTYVTVNGNPNVVCSVLQQPGCGLNTGQATVAVSGGQSPYSYLWGNGATTQTVSGLGAGTYTVLVTDANGCEGSCTVVLTSTQSPNVLVSANGPVCVGSTIQLTSTPSGGTAPYSYTWSGPAGYTSSVQNPTRLNASISMGGWYTLTVTDVNGCTATASTYVTVNANPNVVCSVLQQPGCGLNTGQATVAVSGGQTPYSYLWSNGATTQTVSGLGAGTYTIVVTDANGCEGSCTVVLTSTQSPNVLVNANGPVCVGSTIQLTSTPSGGTAPYSYSWSGPAGYTSSVQNPTRLNAGISMGGWYTLTVTDVNGCTATASTYVTVNGNPNVVCSVSQQPGCGLNTGQATVAVSGGQLPYSYLWSNGATTQTVSGLGAGTYTVLVTDANGCEGSCTVVLTSTQSPNVLVSANGPVCVGSTIQLTSTPSGGTAPYSYTWSGPAGYTSSVQNPTRLNASISMGGWYTLTVTDVNGCTATASTYVTVNANPNVVCSVLQQPGCGLNTGQATVAVSGGQTPYSYLWSNGATTQTVSGLGAGTYTIVVTDANGCEGSCTVVLTSTQSPNVLVNANGPVCVGSTIQLTSTPSGGTAPYSYSWSGPAGYTSSVQNPTRLNAGISMGGWYTLTVTDVNGCTATASTYVTVNGNPNVVCSVSQQPGCGLNTGQATVAVSGGQLPYSYLWSNGATTQTVSGLGAGTYTVLVTDANGCEGSCTVVLTSTHSPYVLVSANGPVCIGSTIQLTSTPSGGTAPYSYSWSGPAGYTSSVQNPTRLNASISMGGWYTLTVTDVNGCTATASVLVNVNANPVVLVNTNSPVCQNSDLHLFSAPSGGNPPYTFSWTGPGGFSSTLQNPDRPDIVLEMAGSYRVTVTDANGCSSTANTVVFVKDVPQIITLTPTDCKPLSNTYDLNIIVNYELPSSGNLIVYTSEGYNAMVPVTNSPQSIILTDLPANGNQNIDVSVYFESYADCSSTVDDAYDAPAACNCNISNILATTICNDHDTPGMNDDYFSLSVNPIGTSLSGQYFVLTVHNGASNTFGPFNYGGYSPQFGSFEIIGGNVVVTVFDSQPGSACNFTKTVLAPAPCSLCTDPILTAGNIECGDSIYNVFFYHSLGSVITVNAGEVAGNWVYSIPLGTDLVITASEGDCQTSIVVKGPEKCFSDCIYPQLTVGQATCTGNAYKVSYTWDGIGNLSRNAGIISGDQIINIPIGTDLVLVATNDSCAVEIKILSPEDCQTPCVNPMVSLSGPICEHVDSAFYSVNYTALPGTLISISAGTDLGGKITNIPDSVSLVVQANMNNCPQKTVIIPAPDCGLPCVNPVLTVGNVECVGSTYNVLFYHSEGSLVTTSSGVISGNYVIQIPIGTNVTIIATVDDCQTILIVQSPVSCNEVCDYPQLTLGQPICTGSTYMVSYTWDGLGDLSRNAGILEGNLITHIPLGIDLVLVATNGECVSKITAIGPDECICTDPCYKPLITLSGPLCGPEGSDHYAVHYKVLSGVTVVTSAGVVGNGIIDNIPAGSPVIVTAIAPGCDHHIVFIPAPVCQETCIDPVLTIGNVICGELSYSVEFYHSFGSVITVNAGLITGNLVSGIPYGTDLEITASDGACETELRVNGPEFCPQDCTQPVLTVGQPVCTGGSYKVSFVWNGAGELRRNSGIMIGNQIINIPIGVDLMLTATNCECEVQLVVVSPEDCAEPCENPAASIGGTICAGDNNTYTVKFTADPWAVLNADFGTIGNKEITGIPSGTPVSISMSLPGCATQLITVPAPDCAFNSLGNYVWHDINGDGIQNNGEPGVDGVMVKLHDSTGQTVKTTQTDPNGFYLFDQLIAGEYFIEVIRPSGYTDFTFEYQGSDPSVDNNIDHANGYGTSSWVFLSNQESDYTIDAGLYTCAEISGIAWYDENVNDEREDNEMGINGLQVKLFRKFGTEWYLWDYTYTQNKPGSPGVSGYWSFCAISGEYFVQIPDAPYGLVQVYPHIGDDPQRDSDLTDLLGSGSTDPFVIISGDDKLDLGAGYCLKSCFNGQVWFDLDKNGIMEANEPGVGEVYVSLFDESQELVFEGMTNALGQIFADNLKRGVYFMNVIPLTGHSFTIPVDASQNQINSDVDHTNGWGTTAFYPVQSGECLNLGAGLTFSTLPVELTTFFGENRTSHNYLDWTTEREENADVFLIERKYENEVNFEPVGQVKAVGNSLKPQQYSFKDYDIAKAGVYYYRLNQRDQNGTSKFSKIVAIVVEGEISNEISIHPNPAKDRFELDMLLSELTQVNLDIIDYQGRIVRTGLLTGEFEKGRYVHAIELNGLSEGIYSVRIQIGSEVVNKRLVIMR